MYPLNTWAYQNVQIMQIGSDYLKVILGQLSFVLRGFSMNSWTQLPWQLGLGLSWETKVPLVMYLEVKVPSVLACGLGLNAKTETWWTWYQNHFWLPCRIVGYNMLVRSFSGFCQKLKHKKIHNNKIRSFINCLHRGVTLFCSVTSINLNGCFSFKADGCFRT